MKYVQLAIITLVLVACGYRPAAAGDGEKNNTQYSGENSDFSMPDIKHPLVFAQNEPDEEEEAEIREQFLDSYYHNVPIPRSTDHWSRVRLMIMWRLVDYLDIDEETAEEFFPIYSDYLRERNELMQEQRRLTFSIMGSVEDEDADIGELTDHAERLVEIEEELVELRRDFLADSEDRLNSRQYIKLFVFDEQMKNDLLRRILPDGRDRGGFPGGPDRNPDKQDNDSDNDRGFWR